jgi:hypothetical protein
VVKKDIREFIRGRNPTFVTIARSHFLKMGNPKNTWKYIPVLGRKTAFVTIARSHLLTIGNSKDTWEFIIFVSLLIFKSLIWDKIFFSKKKILGGLHSPFMTLVNCWNFKNLLGLAFLTQTFTLRVHYSRKGEYTYFPM